MPTTENMRPLDLSLSNLNAELRELIEYRQARLSDTEDRPTEEEIAALDQEIQRYQIATPAKVSGTVAILRRWKAQRETAQAEIKRLKQIEKNIEVMEAWLKDEYLRPILESLPAPQKGARKLVGADGSEIILKRNGSVEPLEITDEAMLPEECVDVTVTMPLPLWLESMEALSDEARYRLGKALFRNEEAQESRAPSNARIRAALAEDCPICDGSGEMLASHPAEGGLCSSCGGSGRNRIAGARLLERSSHVEIR